MNQFILAFIAAESAPSDKAKDTLEYQLQCMRFFLPNDRVNFLNYYASGNSIRDICKWPKTDRCAIECNDNIIREIKFNKILNGQMRIGFAPNTLETLQIVGCQQVTVVNTRLFPKCARVISIASNLYYGTLDLRSLPWNLGHMNASQNRFDGMLNISHLPQSLEHLDLSKNRIRQHTIFYTTIPEKLVIKLAGNRISNAECIYEGHEDLQKHQFQFRK